MPCFGLLFVIEPKLVAMDLAAAVDRSFVDSFLKLARHAEGGESHEFGAVTAYTTGSKFSLFNGCVVVQPAAPMDFGAALDWLAGLGVPHRAFLREDLVSLEGVAVERGLKRDDVLYPGMVLHPIPSPPAPPPHVAIRPVADEADLETFVAASTDDDIADPAIRRLLTPSFASDPDVRLFVAELEGRPVGTSIAIRSDAVSGVYSVGTRSAARGHGVGTAATWAAVEAGRAWGCDTVVLQSSAMGLPIYTRMGFVTVVQYIQLRR
jgi:GNAT superfamily N-acetyltransferase